MANVDLRWMDENDLDRFTDLDRSEVIRTGYEMQDGELTSTPVEWDVPTFLPDGEGEHSVSEQIRFCRTHLHNGGRLIGAFDGEKLVGVGLLTPDVRPQIAQLAYLQVSSGYRRLGLASRMVETLIEWASKTGARKVYVSGTPSESAVGFYLRKGFSPISEPFPELLELEPDDIHMMMDI